MPTTHAHFVWAQTLLTSSGWAGTKREAPLQAACVHWALGARNSLTPQGAGATSRERGEMDALSAEGVVHWEISRYGSCHPIFWLLRI